MAQKAKITIDLGDDELYKAIKIAAVQQRSSLRQVVIEALKDWLKSQEDKEDLKDYREAKGEPSRPFRKFISELPK